MAKTVRTMLAAMVLLACSAGIGLVGMRSPLALADTGNVGPWGDQGDGSYKNPILPGDYQNTDVVQVGSDYYYVTSNKSFSPGMLVMHSRDLVNWEPIGHVVADLTQLNARYGPTVMSGETRGTWAGSIRYHLGVYYVHFTSPDEGIYVSTATNPAGPWSPLTSLKSGPGWDDPCPFWDDNGKAYLVTTNFSDGYTTYLYTMSQDGTKLTDAGTVMYRGQGAEANKLYKIGGEYFRLFSKAISGVRNVYMQRASNIYGNGGSAGKPGTYEERQVERSNGADRQPNQGALVQDATGAWWFVTHQGVAGWEGRSAALLPVTWKNGWPILGADPDGDGIGTMVWGGKKPITGSPRMYPQASDEFSRSSLNPQWEWYYQPRADRWSLTARPGFLRLTATKPLTAGNMKRSADVLTLRTLNTATNTVTMSMDISKLTDGERAGLTIFGSNYRWVGVAKAGSTVHFALNDNGATTVGPAVTAGTVYLQATWDNSGTARFFYSLDNRSFTRIGGTYQIANFGNYIGARVGMFTYNDLGNTGMVDVDWFRYRYENGPPA